MKKLVFFLVGLFLTAAVGFSQSEEKWDRLADRLAEKADQIAESAERNAERLAYFAERNATKIEAEAERLANEFERKWGRDWEVKIRQKNRRHSYEMTPDRVFLGIEANEISDEKARRLGFDNHFGSYVSKVFENSAAKEAGLQPFDYIYGVDDQRTSNNQDLSDILEDFKAGEDVTLYFIRKGEKLTVRVKLGSFEDYEWGEEDYRQGFLGVSQIEDGELDGVPVEVVEQSTAEEMGLQDGDIITRINGYPILDWEDVTTAIGNTSPGDQISVDFERGGKAMQAKGTVKSHEEVYPEIESGDFDVNIEWDEIGDININFEDEDDWGEQSEDRAFLGVNIDMISAKKAEKLGFENHYGSYVTGVIKNTAAEKAGIQTFDYIYGIDEYRVGVNQNLGGILRKYKPGDKATVHIVRKGKKITRPIILGKSSDAEKVKRNSCEDPFLGVVEDGSHSEGVGVRPVKNSTASDLGLESGDVITHINGYKMVDWSDLTAAIDMLKPGETITIDYLRAGKKMKGSKPIQSYAEAKKCEDCDCGSRGDIVINIDKPNFDFNWSREKSGAGETSSPRINSNNASVALENPTAEEQTALKSKGIDFSQSNTLKVESLSLSPDASTGLFSLDFRLPSSGKTVVKVYNLSGRVLYEYDLGRFSGEFSDSVDISQNGAGSYFLQVTQDDKVFTKKIVLTNK